MPSLLSTCPNCAAKISTWDANCAQCGHFLGAPNYRQSLAERDELLKRNAAAHVDAAVRGTGSLLVKLEARAEESRPVISMSFAALHSMLQLQKYRSYDMRLHSDNRTSSFDGHGFRFAVANRLFPGFADNIIYAVLSPDGRGLPNYGEVAVQLDVTKLGLSKRISLTEEGSFTFFNHHNLGNPGATEPLGYRATWDDRAKLAGAKLAHLLTPSTSEAALRSLLLQANQSRAADNYIEIATFAERGLDLSAVDLVTVGRPPTGRRETYEYDIARNSCAVLGIEFKGPAVSGKTRRSSAKLRPKSNVSPRSKIGRAMLKNRRQIALSAAALLLMIDEKIASLRTQRPNSDEAIRERAIQIAHYETLYENLNALRLATEALAANNAEDVAVASVKSFAEGVQSWWTKRHERICERGFEMGLFVAAVAVCSLAGADGVISVAIAGALVGGKPVVDALKSVGKLVSKEIATKE